MKVYTIQTVAFYEELMRNGIAYCAREGYWCRNNRFQYDWMVDQMRKRNGNNLLPKFVNNLLTNWFSLMLLPLCHGDTM